MSGEFFDGFTWAVPKAFSDAVTACRFEEGDILYDSRKAYIGEWSKAVEHINHSLQVYSPSRGSTAAANASGSVFGKNWDTEVTFELQDVSSAEPARLIETTQGKLFTALWRGDLTVFEDDLNPGLPLRLKEVSKMLEQAIPAAGNLSNGKPTFIMARDVANSISKLKHMKVSAALHSRFKAEPKVLMPKEVGMQEWDRVAPTIDVVFYVMESGSSSEIQDALKAQLYVPAENAKKDMFRLSTHGLLIMGK
jgi:hypothetical protein